MGGQRCSKAGSLAIARGATQAVYEVIALVLGHAHSVLREGRRVRRSELGRPWVYAMRRKRARIGGPWGAYSLSVTSNASGKLVPDAHLLEVT